MCVLIMVDVLLRLCVYQTLPPLVVVLAPVNQDCTLVMALSVYVSYCHGVLNSFRIALTALDVCISAANGGCDPNARCVMTGPGMVSHY